MKHTARFATACAALYGLMLCFGVQATDVSTRPLKADVLVKPNVIFGMDDSGSMDSEVMINNNDGAFWWDHDTASGWNASGTTHYNAAGNATATWRKMVYLFPNGTAAGERIYNDDTNSYAHLAIPPTRQFAFLRSSAYNPLYYNPAVTYHPWAPAYVQGASVSYADASTAAAKSHPVFGSSTFNLTATRALNTTANHTFTLLPGMLVPAGSQICDPGSCTWTTQASETTLGATTRRRLATDYFAATYYMPEDCGTVNTTTCVLAPDGTTKLRRYEIRSGATFPSGRSYAAELQNFANWFQYYRKRRLMLASAMGHVMENLTGMRLGVVAFNNRVAVTMRDSDAAAAANNRLRVAGYFYEANGSGGTPTRETLNFIGDQYRRTDTDASGNYNVIQSACQRNNAFIVTDGFANASSVTPPSYLQATWGSGVPYQTTYANTLADIALSYYTNNPRPTMTSGRVTSTPTDSNTDLHMNTYGITLGVRGVLYNGESTPLPANASDWVNPTQNRHPSAVDDLWHATINGRGKKYLGTSPEDTAAKIFDGLNDMLSGVGAQSSVAVSSVNLRRGDGKAYLGVYNPKGWTGDITANAVNPSTGEISTTATWSAATRLLAKNWTTRVIATSVNGVGRPFTATDVGTIVNPSNVYGVTADVINYLRGDRSGENTVPTTFRKRLSLMAAVLNARPAVSSADRVVYAASSEGMVHALDSDTGEELWAYVPGSALSEIGGQTRRTWNFETYLDGSPQLYTVGSRKILIGGRGSAGGGYFALDVTNPRGLTEASLASRVLWEFPTTQAITTSGLSVGQPVVVRTANYGTVALITQGYNGTADGMGRLYVLDALTGALIHTFQANSGEPTLDPGLAQVTGLVEDNGEVRYVYGGDERGNLWRFDLQTRATPLNMALLRDAAGNRQPITAAPTLVEYHGQNIVLVGTGRLLGLTDFGSTQVQSFYAIKDTGAPLNNLRSGPGSLTPRTLSAEDTNGERDLSGAAFNWDTDRGWYFDLPAGQQANTEPAALFGAVVFTTNMAAMSDCSASSYFYAVDIVSGMNVTPEAGQESRNFASARIGDFTVSAITALGYDGRGSRDFGFTFQRSTTRSGGLGRSVDCPVGSSACRSEPSIRLPDMRRKNSWRQVQRQ